MGFPLTGAGLGHAFEKPPGVGGNPQQEGGFYQGVVIGAREQDRVPALGRDLDRLAVVVHLLDEAKQVLPSLACSDRHGHSSIDWYRIWYHFRPPLKLDSRVAIEVQVGQGHLAPPGSRDGDPGPRMTAALTTSTTA